MSVVTIGTPRLTETDVSSVIARAYKLMDEGLAGACIPVETEDGELMVAVLDHENEDLLYGFGRDRSGYYVFDTQGTHWPTAVISKTYSPCCPRPRPGPSRKSASSQNNTKGSKRRPVQAAVRRFKVKFSYELSSRTAIHSKSPLPWR
jgi:hypothetical protein